MKVDIPIKTSGRALLREASNPCQAARTRHERLGWCNCTDGIGAGLLTIHVSCRSTEGYRRLDGIPDYSDACAIAWPTLVSALGLATRVSAAARRSH